MKTITRFQAIQIVKALSDMGLGYLPAEELESIIDNFELLKSEAEKVNRLKAELANRIYHEVDTKRLQSFFDAVQKNEEVAEDYMDLLPLRNKEIEVIVSIYNKVVELDIKEVDGKEFKKAVLKAQPNTKQSAFEVLVPLFSAEENKEDDFSELDEFLMK